MLLLPSRLQSNKLGRQQKCNNNQCKFWPQPLSAVFTFMTLSISYSSLCILLILEQWFPTGVPHGGARGAASFLISMDIWPILTSRGAGVPRTKIRLGNTALERFKYMYVLLNKILYVK